MRALHWIAPAALFVVLPLAGCGGGGQQKPAMYPIKGRVTAVDPGKPSVKLDHEDVPGLMKAMEMTFDVENAGVLEGIRPGDQVQGQLKVAAGKYTITRLEKAAGAAAGAGKEEA